MQQRLIADLEYRRRSAVAKAIRQVNNKGVEAMCKEVEAITVAHINDQMVVECSVQVTLPTASQTTQTSPAKRTDSGSQIVPVTVAFGTQTTAQPTAPLSPISSSSKESEAMDLRPKMMYKNKIVPVHEDACNLIPRIAYYQPVLLPDCVTIKPVEYEQDDVLYICESRSAAVAKKALNRTIVVR